MSLNFFSLINGPIELPTLHPAEGLTFAFIYEPLLTWRSQLILYVRSNSFSPLLEVWVSDERLFISNSFLSDPLYSADIFPPGHLHFVAVEVKPGSITLYVDSIKELEIPIDLPSWEGCFSFFYLFHSFLIYFSLLLQNEKIS